MARIEQLVTSPPSNLSPPRTERERERGRMYIYIYIFPPLSFENFFFSFNFYLVSGKS